MISVKLNIPNQLSRKELYLSFKERVDSGQDGGVVRYTVPPHTTKRRTTNNLKTKNNQK